RPFAVASMRCTSDRLFLAEGCVCKACNACPQPPLVEALASADSLHRLHRWRAETCPTAPVCGVRPSGGGVTTRSPNDDPCVLGSRTRRRGRSDRRSRRVQKRQSAPKGVAGETPPWQPV